jgi:hypothetical protein
MIEMIRDFSSSSNVKANGAKFDIQPYVEVKMKHQNAFACFLFYLEKKYLQAVSRIMYQMISDKIIDLARITITE